MRKKIEEREWIGWDIKNRLLDETGHRCAHCGTHIEPHKNMTLEHIIPLNKGGTNAEANLTVLCKDCNDDKSDKILTPAWYQFLPEDKQAAVEKLIYEYCDSVDYLSENNIFPFDMFDVGADVVMKAKVRGKNSFKISVPLNVKRMNRDEAFEWLEKYGSNLSEQDRAALYKTKYEVKTSLYMVKKKTDNTEIAVFEALLKHEFAEDVGKEINTVQFSWFISPGITIKSHTGQLLGEMVNAVNSHAARYLATTTDGADVITFFHCMLKSDQFCDLVMDNTLPDYSDFVQEVKGVTIRCKVFQHIVGNDMEKAEKLREQIISRGSSLTWQDVVQYSDITNKRLKGD